MILKNITRKSFCPKPLSQVKKKRISFIVENFFLFFFWILKSDFLDVYGKWEEKGEKPVIIRNFLSFLSAYLKWITKGQIFATQKIIKTSKSADGNSDKKSFFEDERHSWLDYEINEMWLDWRKLFF